MKEIRIVTILPSQDQSSVLQCVIDVVSLRRGPEYEALSYRWGDPAITEEIEVSGHRVWITVNLAAAFRQFRSSACGEPVRIWADALCIHQEDREEKGHQVYLMGEVYRRAKRVRVWLGKADEDTPGVFEVLAALNEGPENIESRNTVSAWGRDGDAIQALKALMQDSYWKRRWITQEITLARSVSLHVGHHSIREVNWMHWRSFLVEISARGYVKSTWDQPPLVSPLAISALDVVQEITQHFSRNFQGTMRSTTVRLPRYLGIFEAHDARKKEIASMAFWVCFPEI